MQTLRLWKLGTKERPATGDDIKDFEAKLAEALKNPNKDGSIDLVWYGEIELAVLPLFDIPTPPQSQPKPKM